MGPNRLTTTNSTIFGIQIGSADGNVSVMTPTLIDNAAFSGIFIGLGAGTFTFQDTTIVNQRTGNAGVDLINDLGTVNFTNLNIQTDGIADSFGRVGLLAQPGHVLNLFGSNNIVSIGGAAISLQALTSFDITLDDITSTSATLVGPTSRSGVVALDVGGPGSSFHVTGKTRIDAPAMDGIVIDDANGTFTFDDVEITNVNGDSVSVGQVFGNLGTVNINGGTISNSSGSGHGVRSGSIVNSGVGGIVNVNNTTFSSLAGSTMFLANSQVSGTGNTAVPFSCIDGGGNTGQVFFNGGADACPSGAPLLVAPEARPASGAAENAGSEVYLGPTRRLAPPRRGSSDVPDADAATGLDDPATIPVPAAERDETAVPPQLAPPASSGHSLTAAELAWIVSAATERWSATGLTDAQQASLGDVEFEITDLPAWYLGSAAPGVVRIDVDAGGAGWFVDPTPWDDVEFADDSRSGPAAGRMDLLTTVLHELGHAVGLTDHYDLERQDDVMFGYLTLGERRAPRTAQAQGAVPSGSEEIAFIGAPINIGTLPAGKGVRITFQTTLVGLNPFGAPHVENQGLVLGSNFPLVVTDDPTTTAANDPTRTPLDLPPPVNGLGLSCTPLLVGLNTCTILGGTPRGVVNLALGTQPGNQHLPRFNVNLGLANPSVVA